MTKDVFEYNFESVYTKRTILIFNNDNHLVNEKAKLLFEECLNFPPVMSGCNRIIGVQPLW